MLENAGVWAATAVLGAAYRHATTTYAPHQRRFLRSPYRGRLLRILGQDCQVSKSFQNRKLEQGSRRGFNTLKSKTADDMFRFALTVLWYEAVEPIIEILRFEVSHY